MDFVNHTPFPALAFEGIDQHEQAFHVVVLRQTLTWDENGALRYADEQAPLCEVDTCFDEPGFSSVRQESDLCHFKPKCDVIVNATAYAPPNKEVNRLQVGLKVSCPDLPAPMPPYPQGLNQITAPSSEATREWQAQCQFAQNNPIPGECLINKTLVVTGERTFKKYPWPAPQFATLMRWCTFGLFNANPWRLTAPALITATPLRAEYAFGGECRIDADDKAASRIRKKDRLSPAQLAGHPDSILPDRVPPVAHSAFEQNVVGRGYVTDWYLRARRCRQVSAPVITHADAPLSAALFRQQYRGKFSNGSALPKALQPAGFFIRAKGHPERRALLGTVDQQFIEGSTWLPQDFDFGIWNAAPPDQQTDYLQGDETFILKNLCPADTPGATVDAQGSIVLSLDLPRHECFLLVRMQSGEMVNCPLLIDTVIIEPDQKLITLVWRAVIAKENSAPIRVCEARMRTHEDRDELQREMAYVTEILSRAKQTWQDKQRTTPVKNLATHESLK